MPEPTPSYHKISRSVFSWVVQRLHLWAAEDHLLAVTSTLGFERYRRFYFAEIEAFFWRRTSTSLAWNWVLGGVASLLLGLAALLYSVSTREAAGDTAGAAVVSSVLGGIVAAFLIWNLVRGRTCDAYLQTRHGLDHLNAIGRVRDARRFEARLRPLVLQAQPLGPAPDLPQP